MFMKRNNPQNANEEERISSMFDMERVGFNISRLRKQVGLTQMGLADKLGISFQAISNWDRGVSMPDISKLAELSALFDVSIDEILDNKRTSDIAKNLLNNQPTTDISMEEIKTIAPILQEEQVETLLTGIDEDSQNAGHHSDNPEKIATVAPFLSQQFIDDFARKQVTERQSLNDISAIAPFVSTQLIDEMALEIIEQSGDLSKLLFP